MDNMTRGATARPPQGAASHPGHEWLPSEPESLERPRGYQKPWLSTDPDTPNLAYFRPDPLKGYALSVLAFGNDAYGSSHRAWADLYRYALAPKLEYACELVGLYSASPTFASDREDTSRPSLAGFDDAALAPYSTCKPI